MPWIESHDDIWEHHKLDRLQAQLADALPSELDQDEQRVLLVGHIHALWHFTLRNAWRDADLRPWGDAGIERAARWRRKPGALVAALRSAGLLEEFTPHGWMERAGDLVKKRLDREKVRRERLGFPAPGAVRPPNGATTGSQRCATVTDQTQPNHTKPNPPNPAATRLVNRLVEIMRQDDSKARIPGDLASWEAEADRLMRLDGRTEAEALRVLEWAKRDPFWKPNIMSMGKFREKFSTLVLRMGGTSNATAKINGGDYAALKTA